MKKAYYKAKTNLVRIRKTEIEENLAKQTRMDQEKKRKEKEEELRAKREWEMR